MNGTVVFGISMALLAAFFAQFGLVIQKKRVNTLEARFAQTEIRKPYAADPIWLTAIFMNVVLAVICNSIANSQIGIALAVPIFNGGIVFLVIGLVLICKEKLTKLNLLAVFLLIIGLVLVGCGEVTGIPTVAVFRQNIAAFLIFIAALAILGAAAFIIQKKSKKLMIIALGVLAGCFMTLNLLMGQIIPLAVEAAAAGETTWFLIFTALIVIFGGGGTVGNILCNQKAFKNGNAINYLPIVIAIQNILPVIVDVSVLQQTVGRIWCFYPGLLLIIVGAALLSKMQADAA